ncbi:MAG: O-antigen ligase family protein, partial [Verrucomicrobia bacterium]|nr:O-antigen ligase family protein [Verrucomicrobiota bacterium]
LFSPLKSIGWDGVDVGWDTYGLYSIFGYLAFFIVIGTKLRTRAQIERLIWTLTAASILVSVYGIGQHFGVDWLRNDQSPVRRAGMTFGNPIFGPAYLVMTIPLTIAAIMAYRDRMAAATHIWIGAGLIAAQLTAIVFSQSRGPFLSLVVGIVVFFAVVSWVQGWRQAIRPASMVLVAIAMAMLMNVIPVVNQTAGSSFGERVFDIGPDAAGGAQNRLTIWDTSWDVFTKVPWPDTNEVPDIPDLGVRFLRPIVGYGPDMFGYAYPLAGDTDYTNELASHGHNFIVHTAIELGLLGVAAYLFLLGSVGVALFLLTVRARAGAYPDWFAYVVIGLTAAMVTRVVEQLAGKAQVSDLQLMWVLTALAMALSLVGSSREGEADEPATEAVNRRERRRGSRRDVRLSAGSASVIRLALAGVIVLSAGVMWTQTVANVFWSSMIGADARDAAAAGRSQEALEKFRNAVEMAPDSAVNNLNLAALFFQAGLQGNRTKEERIDFLQAADDVILKILDRNPLDHRAWSRHGEYLREIAALDSSLQDEAALAAETLVDLMPGFWQPRTAQALALVRIGLFEAGLEVVQQAKDIRVLETPGAQFIYFIEASAYEELERFDDAIEAAHCSLAHTDNSNAVALLERLGAPPGDGFDLTPSEAERCPEVTATLR